MEPAAQLDGALIQKAPESKCGGLETGLAVPRIPDRAWVVCFGFRLLPPLAWKWHGELNVVALALPTAPRADRERLDATPWNEGTVTKRKGVVFWLGIQHFRLSCRFF